MAQVPEVADMGARDDRDRPCSGPPSRCRFWKLVQEAQRSNGEDGRYTSGDKVVCCPGDDSYDRGSYDRASHDRSSSDGASEDRGSSDRADDDRSDHRLQTASDDHPPGSVNQFRAGFVLHTVDEYGQVLRTR